jgi:hypothetical protein
MRILYYSVVVAISLTNAACTTSLVNAGREDAAHPLREFGDIKAPLVGAVAGSETIGEQRYVRIVIPAARQTCAREEPLELLLPDSPEGTGILREARAHPEIAASRKVTIYGPRYSAGRPPIEERVKTLEWLRTLRLPQDGVSPLIIEHNDRMGLKASYKIGNASSEPRSVVLDVQSDWVCRSHAKHALMMALYVPAVAVDLITSPIQIVLFLLTAH